MMSTNLIKQFHIRNCRPEDHADVVAVIKDWWGGRDLAYALPRLFFDHFNNSSFVARHQENLVGFLIGFLSQSKTDQGYIHFAGVHPDYRHIGLASHLFHRFFEVCRAHGRHIVTSCTSPVNTGSVAFHTRLGFDILPGDARIDGIDITRDYNRPDDPKVLFQKVLEI